MATFYSEQVTKLDSVPAEPVNVNELHGKVRIARFDYTQAAEGAIGTVIELVKLPAGKVRILGKNSALYHTALGAGVTLDVGWDAYKSQSDGSAVAADPDGLDDGLDVAAAGTKELCSVQVTDGASKLIDSQDGVTITCTIGGAVIPAAGELNGYICYVAD